MSEIPNEPASVIEDFLRSHGAAGLEHPGGTLLEHLIRVSRRLAAWGASGEIRLAGLCHAAYGTDGFAETLLDLTDRAVLVQVIGERAEALVYFYASCDRGVTYPRLRTGQKPMFRDRFSGVEFDPADADLRAFLEITAANELDVFEHNEELASRYGAGFHRLMESVRGSLSAPAWAAVDVTLRGHAAEA